MFHTAFEYGTGIVHPSPFSGSGRPKSYGPEYKKKFLTVSLRTFNYTVLGLLPSPPLMIYVPLLIMSIFIWKKRRYLSFCFLFDPSELGHLSRPPMYGMCTRFGSFLVRNPTTIHTPGVRPPPPLPCPICDVRCIPIEM
jgi:hypothetical protein